MSCPKCGFEAAEGSLYCGNCGEPLRRPGSPSGSGEPTGGQRVIAVPDLLSTAPRWLTQGWGGPGVLALVAVVIGLIIQYLAGVLTIVGVLIGRQAGEPMPWGALLRLPAEVWLAFHGGISGSPMTVTGLTWIVVSFLLARRITRSWGLDASFERVGLSARTGVVAATLKTAVIYAALVVVVSIIVNAIENQSSRVAPLTGEFGSGGTAPAGGTGFSVSTNLAAALFMSLVIATLTALRVFLRESPQGATETLGIPISIRVPEGSGAVWSGAKRVVLIGFVGMLAFRYAGTLLDQVSQAGGPSGKELAAEAVILIPTLIIWSGVDVGLLTFIFSLRFFTGVSQLVPSGKPGWIYIAMVISVIAFIWGGYLAARRASNSDGWMAVKVAVAVGPVVAVLCAAFAIFRVSLNGSGGTIATALFLPVLWGALSALGGMLYANRSGAAVGVTVSFPSRASAVTAASAAPHATPTRPGPAGDEGVPAPAVDPVAGEADAGPPQPVACPRCGTPNLATSNFCDSCGSPLR